MKNKKRRGFTLVELLVVLLILGVLVGLAVPRYMEAQKTARARTFAANVREIVSTLEVYRMDQSTATAAHYPADLSALDSYFTQPPINPYTGKSMLSSTTTDSGIEYQSDGTSYSICITQQDVDDINNNGRTDDPLPVTSYPACTSCTSTSQYTVSAAPNNPSYGTVTGSDTYNCGSTATLTAEPNIGYTFVGWYENVRRVSTATTYTFTVKGNRTLEARFKSSYVIVFQETFDSEASLSNWVAGQESICESLGAKPPTLSIDNGALRIDGVTSCFPYAQRAIAIETPNPRRFVIEGDVKTGISQIKLGFRSIDGQELRFGFFRDHFELQNTYTVLPQFRSYTDWMHIKVVVNDNVMTGYVGTASVITVNTDSTFMPGYIELELWGSGDGTGWFDNITVYGY